MVAVLERALQAAGLKEVADAEEDLDAVERLRHEVAGAEAERAAARGGRVVGGEHEDGDAGADDPLEHREAVDARQLEVEDHQIRVCRLQERLGLHGDRGDADVLVAGRGEDALQQGSALGVLDYDNALGAAASVRHDHHGPRVIGGSP